FRTAIFETLEGIATRDFDGRIHVGESMLDRLKGTDRLTEGPPLESVVAGRLQAGLGASYLFEAGHQGGMSQYCPCGLPASRVQRLGDRTAKAQCCQAPAVVRRIHCDALDAAVTQIDQCEHHAVGCFGTPLEYDDQIGES